MRILSGRVARFWLSPEGKVALQGVFEKEAFQVYVHSVDELGCWVRPKNYNSVLLLKHEYIATAHVEVGVQTLPDTNKDRVQ